MRTINPRIHSVKFNVLMNMVLTSSSFVFPLITIPYVSRILSTYGMGAVAFAQSVVSYFSLAALLGIQYYGVRVCAAVRDDKEELSKTVKEILVILVLSTSIVFLSYCLCLFVVPQFINERLLFIEFGLTIWLTAFGVEWFYQALEQYGYITVRNVLFKLISLVLMFLFVRAQEDYIVYGAIVIFAGGASNILNMFRLRKLINFKTHQTLNVKRHLKPMKWFTVAAVSSGMYTQVDIVLLGFLGTTNMVGIYQLVSKIKSVLVPAVNAVGSVILPRLSYYQAKRQRAQVEILISKNINFAVLTGMGIMAILVLCANPIVLILGGSDFADSSMPLMLISPSILFSALNIVLANHMISSQQERFWATVNVVGLAIAVVSNILLIPVWGVNGAAVSISVCEFCMFVMRCVACRGLLISIRKRIDPVKIIFCAAVALALGFSLMKAIHPNAVIELFGGSGTFGTVYLALLLVVKEKFTYSLCKTATKKFRIGRKIH